MGPFFSLVNISVVFTQRFTILQDGYVDFKHPRGDGTRKPMGEGSWAVSLVISGPHSSCPSPSPPSLPAHFPALSQHLCQLLSCVEGEFGGNPSSSSDGLWFFLKLTGNLLLWNLGFFSSFPFMNQHRAGLCGPEKVLEYKSC